MPKITPFLWFDNNAEEAVHFYTSIFKNSRVIKFTRRGDDGPVVYISCELEGQVLHALNGGPHFTFNEAISLFVDYNSQAEVDDLWHKLLSGGGEEQQCGWLKDKFGLVWQIVPAGLTDYLYGEDPIATARATQAMLQMKKLDLEKIRQAYENKESPHTPSK